jgi:hypothetical protein
MLTMGKYEMNSRCLVNSKDILHHKERQVLAASHDIDIRDSI